MRFAAVHKAASYLMVLVTLAPIALAGDLPLFALLLFAIAMAGSWWIERGTLKSRTDRLWDAGIVLLFLGLALDVARGGPIITNLEYLLLGFLVHRLYNRRTSRDFLWLYVLCFLMFVIGTTVSTSISFIFLFLAYIILVVWNLVFHHLRREMEDNYLLRHADATQSERVEVARVLNSRRIVGPSFLGGTALLALGVFLGALLIFFTFPRIGFGFSFGGIHTRTAMAGFSDTVKLGHHGTIKDNPEVVMRVALPQAPKQALRWRGAAFSSYQDGQWTHRDTRQYAMRERAGLGAHSSSVMYTLPPPPHAETPLHDRLERSLGYDVFLEPLESTVVFAADRPVAFEIPEPFGKGPRLVMGSGMEVRTDRLRTTTLQYRAYSEIVAPGEAELLQTGEPEIQTSPYLELPPDLPAEVDAMAQRITRGASGRYAKVRATIDYLLRNYQYTLDLKHDAKLDPVYEFLFVRRAGHCEYFASALALLLRAVNVPTRVVNGFLGGAWNDIGKFLAVRQGDAHSWVEVYFSGVGWVAFDATPPAGQTAQAAPNRLRMALDAARLTWLRWVIEYDLARQVDVLRQVGHWLGGKPLPAGYAGAQQALGRLVRPALIGGAILLGIVVLMRLRPWRRLRVLQPNARPRPRDPATRLYCELLARLERAGLHKRPSQTANEFLALLRANAHHAAPLTDQVTQVYYESRFGGVTPDPVVLQSLANAVRRADLASTRNAG